MHHLGTQTLTTDRLILRPFSVEDAEAAFRNWVHDERVCKFLTWQPHKDIGETRRIFSEWAKSYRDPAFYQWAIVLKKLGEPIGSISVVSHDDSIEMVHMGYCIGYDWWHQGITVEAFHAVIDYLFGEVDIKRIESLHDLNNPRSGFVMKACGLTYEGTLRKAARNNTGIVDVARYAILKEDWIREREPSS